MGRPRRPRLTPKTQICCLVGRQEWTAPELGLPCRSSAHSHLTFAKVQELIDQEKAEWVPGQRQVCRAKTGTWETEPCWIPVIRLVNARRWKKTPSFDGRVSVATMQLVAGG